MSGGRGHLLGLLLLAGAGGGAAQVRDTSLAIPLVKRGQTRVEPFQWLSATAVPISVRDFGAYPTLATDQATPLQAAITYACSQATPPPVFVPAGSYAVGATGLTVPAGCTGFTLKGAGQNTSVLCYFAGSTGAPMLTVGVTTAGGANVTDLTVEDIGFSGFCGGTFPPGIDLNCNHCHLSRVLVTGYTVFAFRFAGAASLGASGAGFTTVSDCQIQNGAASSFAVVVVTQTGTTGGPDGNALNHCYVNTNNGWWNDSTVAGATNLRSSQSLIGNRFEASGASAAIAFQGNRQDDRIVGNRFEQTGAGGLTITLANTLSTDPTAYFIGNLWACGPGLCTFTDASPTKAIRIGETFGPSTAAQPPGVNLVCSTATSLASPAGASVTLRSCNINAGTVNGSGSTFLHVRAWGHTANNANGKTVGIKIAGLQVITFTLTASAVDQWSCDLIFGWAQTGANPQSVGGECTGNATGTVAVPSTANPSFDWGAAQNVNVPVTQTSAGDVTQDGFFVEIIEG